MKRALVLGVTGSLGNAIAASLREDGYTVIGSTRVQHTIEGITLHQLDMTDRASITRFCEQMQKEGPFDFFTSTISNTPTLQKFEQMPLEKFEADLNVNVLSHIFLLQQLLPAFNAGANIVFILSEQVVTDRLRYTASYTISKYALLGLTKVLAGELEQRKIRVNAVSPGMMDTKFVAKLPSFVKESYRQKAGDLVTPHEVAEAIRGIRNDPSMNGENITVYRP